MRVAKCDPLRTWLMKAASPATMTFDDVGRLVGGLPPSAYRYLAWWSNEGKGSHVQARAWMNAGRRVTQVDLQSQTVEFS